MRLDFQLDTEYLFCHVWANSSKVYTLTGPQTCDGLQGGCHETLSATDIGGHSGANADMFTSIEPGDHQKCRR